MQFIEELRRIDPHEMVYYPVIFSASICPGLLMLLEFKEGLLVQLPSVVTLAIAVALSMPSQMLTIMTFYVCNAQMKMPVNVFISSGVSSIFMYCFLLTCHVTDLSFRAFSHFCAVAAGVALYLIWMNWKKFNDSLETNASESIQSAESQSRN